MTYDDGGRQTLDLWLDQPHGKFWLKAVRALIRRALSSWASGDSTLLEVNCGSGWLQPTLRTMGFDVTGCESSPALRALFMQRLGTRYVVDPAPADALPYGNGQFDWVLVHLEQGMTHETMARALCEAGRVAGRGVAALYWNKLSLAGWHSVPHLPLTPLYGMRVRRVLRSITPGRMHVTSCLALPVRCWGKTRGDGLADRVRDFLNGPLPGGRGAVCLAILESGPAKPLTATPLRVRRVVFRNNHIVSGAWEGQTMGPSATLEKHDE